MNWRLRRAGGRLIRDATIRFRYLTRPTWELAFRQYRNYGRARVAVVARHPAYLRPHHLMPSVAVVGLAALFAASPFSRRARSLAAMASATYGVAACIAAGAAGARSREALDTVAAFTALHAGYGVGMLEALLALVSGATRNGAERASLGAPASSGDALPPAVEAESALCLPVQRT